MAVPRSLLTCANRRTWRGWLKCHHRTATHVWLIIYKKGARTGSLSLNEAVEEALCFGWIDGQLRGIDDAKYSLRFSPRRAKSVWSATNVRRVEKLTRQGLMTRAGLEKVAEGRRSGQWDAATSRERTDVIPADLQKALRRTRGALFAYRKLPSFRKKQFLYWLSSAKKPETKQKRLAAIVREVSG